MIWPDRFAERIPAAAPIGPAILETTSGELTYRTASHPAPLIVTTSGDARYLQPSGGGPLGRHRSDFTRRRQARAF